MKKILFVGWMATLGAQCAELGITFYRGDAVERPLIRATVSILERIFRLAGVNLHWTEAPSDAGIFFQYITPATGPQWHEQKCRASRDIHVRIVATAPPHIRSSIVGYSSPLSDRGINVTIFQNAADAIAEAESLPVAVVLAHGIAHEIGHVLMRSAAHYSHGLMASAWRSKDFELMRNAYLCFQPDEAKSIRATLAGEGCEDVQDIRSRGGRP